MDQLPLIDGIIFCIVFLSQTLVNLKGVYIFRRAPVHRDHEK